MVFGSKTRGQTVFISLVKNNAISKEQQYLGGMFTIDAMLGYFHSSYYVIFIPQTKVSFNK